MVAVHEVGVHPSVAAAEASHDAELVPDGSVAFACQLHHGLLHLLRVAVQYASLPAGPQPAVVVRDEEEADLGICLAYLVHEAAVGSLESLGIELRRRHVGIVDADAEDDEVGRTELRELFRQQFAAEPRRYAGTVHAALAVGDALCAFWEDAAQDESSAVGQASEGNGAKAVRPVEREEEVVALLFGHKRVALAAYQVWLRSALGFPDDVQATEGVLGGKHQLELGK